MIHKRAFFPLLVALLYNVSILLYTFYGVSKSATEYFCLQKRPDNVDYVSTFTAGWITMNIEQNKGNYVSINHTIFKVTVDENVFEKWGGYVLNTWHNSHFEQQKDNIEWKYKVNGSYFKVKCEVFERSSGPLPDDTKNGTFRSNGVVIDYNGFVGPSFHDIVFLGGYEAVDSSLQCILEKAPETCSVDDKFNMNFFRIYAGVVLFVLFCILCLNLDGKTRPVMRFMKKYILFLNKFDGYLTFCNPITGEPYKLLVGQEVWVFQKGHYIDEGFMRNQKVNSLEDNRGRYEFISEKELLVIERKEEGGNRFVINMEGREAELLKSYFAMILTDPKKCVLNDKHDHYLPTLEVIYKLLNGYCFKREFCKKETFALDVDMLNVKLITTQFKIRRNLVIKLLEHNKLFFKKLKINALIQCLNSQMFFWNRPEKVNNSQWKWYTSDFCHFMNENIKSNYKSQCVWRKSKALLSTENNEEIVINEPLDTLEVEIKPEYLKKEKPKVGGGGGGKIHNVLSFGVLKLTEENNNDMVKSQDFLRVNNNRLGRSMKEIQSEMVRSEEENASVNDSFFKSLKNGINKNVKEDLIVKKEKVHSELNRFAEFLTPYKDAILNPEVKHSRQAQLDLKKAENMIEQVSRRPDLKEEWIQKRDTAKRNLVKDDPSQWILPKFKMQVRGFVTRKKMAIEVYDKLLNLLGVYEKEEEDKSHCVVENKNVKVKINVSKLDFTDFKFSRHKIKSKSQKPKAKRNGRRIPKTIHKLKKWVNLDISGLINSAVDEMKTGKKCDSDEFNRRSVINMKQVLKKVMVVNSGDRTIFDEEGESEKKNVINEKIESLKLEIDELIGVYKFPIRHKNIDNYQSYIDIKELDWILK